MDMEAVEPFVLFGALALRLEQSCLHDEECLKDLDNATAVLLRMCVGDPDVVHNLIRFNTLVTVSHICRYLALSKSTSLDAVNDNIDKTDAMRKKLTVKLCRLVSNFTACGEGARRHLFEINKKRTDRFEALSHILSAAVVSEDRSAVAAVVSAIYNCLQCSETLLDDIQDAVLARNDAFCESRSILCQLLLAVLPSNKLTLTATGDPESSTESAQVESTIDLALEWFHMLAFHWVRIGAMAGIYRTVGPTVASMAVAFTHEQLVVLQLSLNVMEDPYCTEVIWGTAAESGGHSTRDPAKQQADGVQNLLLSVTKDLCLMDVCSIFHTTDRGEKLGESASLEGEDAVECEICLVERRMQRGLVRDFLPLALQLLASALAVAPRVAGRGLRERLAGGTDLLETAEKILGQSFLHKYSTRPAQAGAALGPAATSKPVEPSADMSMVDAERLREAAKLTLQMLGNLVHGCETAQDALRTSGVLAAVLSHCGTDFENPISREWALLCVRNACENHPGNQQFIHELQPQETVIQDEKLRAQGLKVEINKETGKFKIPCSTVMPHLPQAAAVAGFHFQDLVSHRISL